MLERHFAGHHSRKIWMEEASCKPSLHNQLAGAVAQSHLASLDKARRPSPVASAPDAGCGKGCTLSAASGKSSSGFSKPVRLLFVSQYKGKPWLFSPPSLFWCVREPHASGRAAVREPRRLGFLWRGKWHGKCK